MSPGGECELELYNHPKGSADKPAGPAALGFRHVAFAVEDIYQAVDDLKARGIAFALEPPPKGQSGPRIAFFNDPEGNSVELVEE